MKCYITKETEVEKYTFIDRYFHSQYELLDIRQTEERDINTLFSYLENLHATGDKLKDMFGVNIKSKPEFKLLRLIRNYFHHVGDVDEIRLYVSVDKEFINSHLEHFIIPLEIYAKSLKSFIDKNTVKETNKNYERKLDYVGKEIASIITCCDCQSMISELPLYCDSPSITINNNEYALGFDIYKFIYNITNEISDICRNIDELCSKQVISNLDDSYTCTNNIEKNDLMCRASDVPALTTQGYVFSSSV